MAVVLSACVSSGPDDLRLTGVETVKQSSVPHLIRSYLRTNMHPSDDPVLRIEFSSRIDLLDDASGFDELSASFHFCDRHGQPQRSREQPYLGWRELFSGEHDLTKLQSRFAVHAITVVPRLQKEQDGTFRYQAYLRLYEREYGYQGSRQNMYDLTVAPRNICLVVGARRYLSARLTNTVVIPAGLMVLPLTQAKLPATEQQTKELGFRP